MALGKRVRPVTPAFGLAGEGKRVHVCSEEYCVQSESCEVKKANVVCGAFFTTEIARAWSARDDER